MLLVGVGIRGGGNWGYAYHFDIRTVAEDVKDEGFWKKMTGDVITVVVKICWWW